MGIKNIIKNFETKKLKLEQKQTAGLNKKRLKLKAKYEREKVKDKHRNEIKKYDKGLLTFKDNKKSSRKGIFNSKVKNNIQNRANTKNDAPYWMKDSGNSGSSMFGSSSPPYWLQSEEKKEKKERGKSITIRL